MQVCNQVSSVVPKKSKEVNSIKFKPSSSKRNIKVVMKRVSRIFVLVLGIFFVILGAELFLFVHEETVIGVVYFLIGVGFLLYFYTTRKRRELKPINNSKLSDKKGVTKVRDESWKERKEQ